MSPAEISGHAGSQPELPEGKRVTMLGAVLLTCGYVSQLWISGVGQLYWAEMILPAVALALVLHRWPAALFHGLRFRLLATGLLLMLVGYIVSDVVAGTSAEHYLKGWFRVLVLGTDAISLVVIYDRNRWALWWFWLGNAVFGLQTAILAGIPLTLWKFGYAEPITTGAVNASVFLPGWLSGGIYLLLGALSIVLDYRSLGAVLLVAGAILLMSRSSKSIALIRSTSLSSLIALVLGLAAAAAVANVLLTKSNEDYAERRSASDVGRFAGVKIGVIAITDSPLLGYGSGGEGTQKYAEMMYADAVKESLASGGMPVAASGFLPHSQILQAWMEGGVLAAFYFLTYGCFLIVTIRDLAVSKLRTPFRGFMLVLLLTNLWHLFMSPFMGGHRLNIASAVALIVCSALSDRQRREQQVAPRLAARALAPPNLMQ
jgi:hypothetical protein